MSDDPMQTEAVGKIPSGLFIIVAKSDEQIDGFLGSFVQQVSMDPLRISFAIKKGRPAYDLIQDGQLFTVNVVGDHERGFLKQFWSGYDPDKKPFDQLAHRITDQGGLIIEDALATMECRRTESYSPGDHELIIADVLACHTLHPDAKPWVHIRKHGLTY